MVDKHKNAFQIIKHRHITEKSTMLGNLKSATSNPSLKRFELPKYVFVVDRQANKHQIAHAIEEIYRAKNVKVVSVNTINVKPKARRVRGRAGMKPGFKKAIVTLEKGDELDGV